MLTIDINCDMGEGVGNDEAIMPFISSANIACGYHAGDEGTMRHTIQLALQNNVAIGAHPSFFDKKNFGRVEMNLPADEIYDLVILQLRTIDKIIKEEEAKLHHVKPHGALYNMAAKNPKIALAIAQAVKDFDDELILFVLSGSDSKNVPDELGLRTANEVFADRTYQDDGSLTPRSQANALIEDEEQAMGQALQMIKEKTVTTLTGKTISVVADTICIHGDGSHAVQFAKAINEKLKMEGVSIKSFPGQIGS
ncbi:MAG: LamB/YcsF family protein [Bacteroidetes bacterium]|nr:MAG: LamB/YcsF family protein [Bacteroidota bacterium]